MEKTRGWLIALVVAALLVTACGPQMATPTAKVADGQPTTAAVSTPTSPPQVDPTTEPVVAEELPVDPGNWHALGPADAKVTLIEYSDFQ